MDELVEKLESSHVSFDIADTTLIHPRYSLYKNKGLAINQEERRRIWLERQKSNRFKSLNVKRGIEDFSDEDSCSGDLDELGIEEKKKSEKRPDYRKYKQWLMLSEWMIEVPPDLSQSWLCTFCPEGKRALVVAQQGSTSAYGRRGQRVISTFPSWLPGGSRVTRKGTTILDTIFDYKNEIFYCLDILQWGTLDTENLEADMRFYWLQDKLTEVPELATKMRTNRYCFVALQHVPICHLQERALRHPVFPENSPQVDGVLFYHRESLYVRCRSPLVVWLKPFMLPDILAIPVAQQYLNERPSNYAKMSQMETEEAPGAK